MGILGNLFGSNRQSDPLDEVRGIIDRFTTATHAGVDAEDIGRYPAKQHKVMAFHYGAIADLANSHGLDETQTLALFVMFVDKYFNLPVSETGSISQRLDGFMSNPEERGYMDAGRNVFRRWHEKGDRHAPLELGDMLKEE